MYFIFYQWSNQNAITPKFKTRKEALDHVRDLIKALPNFNYGPFIVIGPTSTEQLTLQELMSNEAWFDHGLPK